MMSSETKLILDGLTSTFFRVFNNGSGRKVNLDPLKELFITEGIIIKNCGTTPEIYTLRQFIEPREKLLNDGSLTDFKEEELFERTEIFGNIAHRFSLYQKSGLMHGVAFKTKGMKTIQFIKSRYGWKISSLAWDDEREGLIIPNEYIQVDN
ncbi:hypothetical protein QQ008_02630 [Fulvivirgaceae bacterium BMA10]|uniref:DUF4440 domain-containing protein n=1 Tax=Splendidivirga corallicola TaxID=3051826 RepID=A0ABT8KHP8_9BACT|nr:hypothetical protein [Fulvivirgaceae bacterium BMA10]